MSDIIAEMLPTLRGYVINHYWWIAYRGHCLFDIDDIVQLASIMLVKLSRKFEAEGRSIESASEKSNFFAYLKGAVKHELLNEMRDTRFDVDVSKFNSLDEPPLEGSEQSGAEISAYRTAMMPRTPDMLHGELAEYYTTLPRRTKTLFALRYFDQMTVAQVRDLMDMAWAGNGLMEATRRWRSFALNRIADDPAPLTRLKPHPWEPTPALAAYIEARYHTDLPGYLGLFTIALQVDVGYLIDILGPYRTYAPDAFAARRALSSTEARRADDLLAAGWTHQRIADTLAVSRQIITDHAKRRAA